MRIGDSRRPDVVDFGDVEPSSGSIRGRDGYQVYTPPAPWWKGLMSPARRRT